MPDLCHSAARPAMVDAPSPVRIHPSPGGASERVVSGLMAAYFFVVITVFWVLKPLKKALFLRFYAERPLELPGGLGWLPSSLDGAQAELLAKVLNIGVAVGAASVFAALARRHRRERLSTLFGCMFACAFALLAQGFTPSSQTFTWAFYLFGDLFNMVMVATFFAHLNDLVSARVARRSYAFVVLGGVLGGVFGSTVVRAYVSVWSIPTWLSICAACSLAIVALGLLASRRQRSECVPDAEQHAEAAVPVAAPVREGLAGARVVLGSRYLVTIAGIVAVYEVVSTVLDFQFSATVSHYLRGPAIGEQLATVFLVTNVVSLCVQLLCTRFVMERLGVRAALSVLPFAVLVVASGFALMPLLWVGSSLSIADNALNYSMNQSARESLYVPAQPREKYQAKAFIDIVVQRAAKACGVVLSLGMSVWCKDDLASVRALSLVVVVLAGLWLAMARYAGSRFEELVEGA
jgi:ATP:ADP antiporter, AAA family